MTSVPDITRLLARIEDWKSQGPPLGRADAARRIDEAQRLLDEFADMLVEMHIYSVRGNPHNSGAGGPGPISKPQQASTTRSVAHWGTRSSVVMSSQYAHLSKGTVEEFLAARSCCREHADHIMRIQPASATGRRAQATVLGRQYARNVLRMKYAPVLPGVHPRLIARFMRLAPLRPR